MKINWERIDQILIEAKNKFKEKNVWVFDLDGTICSQVKDGQYKNANPFQERIEVINRLYDDGKTIIIWTARGMNRFNGDVEKVYKEFYELTLKQLKEWNVKYHHLELGKMKYDVFVDDRALSDIEFFRGKK